MVWYIISCIAFVAAAALLIYTYFRDRRYERKKASGAMDPALYRELEDELEMAVDRHRKFEKALKEAQGAKK